MSDALIVFFVVVFFTAWFVIFINAFSTLRMNILKTVEMPNALSVLDLQYMLHKASEEEAFLTLWRVMKIDSDGHIERRVQTSSGEKTCLRKSI